ncbi:Glycerol-3-phosphate dehydrogenase (plasmid) [Rubrobacter radiotolerans]|uniref:Glycerol-3-phosphate dehydrogenase n=1 Tax=Rubrobacter radiotolerans TaxID=42256 RepID=A0A023X796_RUBRA|nr:glycerol-3-phosphate dehydrogenase/oxidase [Rubrobacter radiotolerans]AHY48317.1 Glycerol-3-phosphate dehydrogenase [Rubrobacter radiotolerans]MDX5895590.1 glycerol-3-phosphate dehydrogenase/oxidase [Rubrobacter radiotolerans]SMC01514.1 glycerol-3-phosphate dehydrogenase [Rubrobacter radiotolerans DSM 5868]
MVEREKLLAGVQQRPFDVIVVGAGINGAGVARDAAMRGLRVLMLDKGDIASGTTQWATRLIHGGLRYLEHYEVPLVRESLKDREILLHIAPHLVKPLKFVVPIYERSSRGPRMIRLGMIAYDTLSYDKSVPNHKMLSREEALREYPGLNPDGLLGAATYYDAQVEYAERIAVENAVSAVENGATVLTYAEVTRLLFEGNGSRVVGVEFRDRLSEDGAVYSAHAPVTVNVAGPWVDRVLGGSGSVSVETSENGGSDSGRMIGGTKGSHIVVDPFPGAPKNAIYVEARKDGRPYFIVPWNGLYLIGTTDFRYRGDLDYVKATEDEIQYLIDETNFVVPEANLSRDSVLFTYSGVRPLPFAPEGSEGSISRSHVVYDHAKGKSAAGGRIKVHGGGSPRAEGLLSIVGGKLTTYRNLGRQTTNVVYKKLGVKPPKSATDRIPLPGGKTPDLSEFSEEFRQRSGLADVLSRRLVRLYGARAYDVLAEAGDDDSLKEPLTDDLRESTALLGCEVLYAFRREQAQKLADVLLRRTMVSYGPHVALDVDEAAARVCVEHLGWSEERARREVEEYREWIERYTPKAFREGVAAG